MPIHSDGCLGRLANLWRFHCGEPMALMALVSTGDVAIEVAPGCGLSEGLLFEFRMCLQQAHRIFALCAWTRRVAPRFSRVHGIGGP